MIEQLGKDVIEKIKIDLFLVWFVNSTGCGHRVFHLIFNEPDLYKDMSNPLCCEWCHVERDGSAEIDLLGIPIHETVGCQVNQLWLDKWVPKIHSLSSAGTSKPPMVLPAVNKARLEVLVSDINHWRNNLVQSSGNIHGLSASQFIRDNAIDKIRARIRYIKTETDLQEVLRLMGYRFPTAFISDHVPDLLRCIQNSLSNTQHLQHRNRLPSPSRYAISEVVLPSPVPLPGLPWLKTIADVDTSMRIAQDQAERNKRIALQKGKEEKERERKNTKELLKVIQEQERKREALRDREMKKQALAAKYEYEKKVEARKQKEMDRQALKDITNESQRRSGRKRQALDRWEG